MQKHNQRALSSALFILPVGKHARQWKSNLPLNLLRVLDFSVLERTTLGRLLFTLTFKSVDETKSYGVTIQIRPFEQNLYILLLNS